MTTSPAFASVPNHFISGFGGDAPFHTLARFVRRACYLNKVLVERQIVADGILLMLAELLIR